MRSAMNRTKLVGELVHGLLFPGGSCPLVACSDQKNYDKRSLTGSRSPLYVVVELDERKLTCRIVI